MEGWNVGILEGWKNGRMEGWNDGRLEKITTKTRRTRRNT